MSKSKSSLRLISYNEIMKELECSKTLASKILTDIRKENNIRYVTYEHFKNYLNIS